jgi:hypothetical protein
MSPPILSCSSQHPARQRHGQHNAAVGRILHLGFADILWWIDFYSKKNLRNESELRQYAILGPIPEDNEEGLMPVFGGKQ